MKRFYKYIFLIIMAFFLVGCEEHPHEFYKEVVKPTCTRGGYSIYKCDCGFQYIDEVIEATGHTELVIKGERVSCTTNGYTDGIICTSCDRVLVKQIEVPAIGHVYGPWVVVVESTETEIGLYEKTCNVCQNKVVEEMPIKEHVHKYDKKVTAPTCTEQGYTTYTCKCEDTYKTDYIDSLGHKYSEWAVIKEPTENVSGAKSRICTRCYDKVEEIIPPLNHTHNYKKEMKEATCTEKGYVKLECACGDKFEVILEAKGHLFGENQIIKNPTENEEGTIKNVCDNCKYEKITKLSKLPHEHIYSQTVVPSTCIEKGYTKYTCRCGHAYNDNYIDMLPHEYGDFVVTVEPTETTKGVQEKTCKYCNDIIKEEIAKIPHTHKFSAIVIEPTCTEKGYTIYICQCNETYNEDYCDPIGHKFIELEELFAPTCETPGIVKCECEVCKLISNEEIPVIKAHKGVLLTIIEEANCSTEGVGLYQCELCSAMYKDKVEINDVHTPVLVAVIKQPTCTVDGAGKYECEKCGKELEYTTIEAQHKPLLAEILKQPTCEVSGLAKYICEYCNTSLGYRQLAPAHNWSELVVEKEPTPVNDGLGIHICKECQTIQEVIIHFKKDEK